MIGLSEMNISKTLELNGHKFEINSVGCSFHYVPNDRYNGRHIMVPTEIMLVKAILELLKVK